MANNQYINKVVFGDTVLIDLSNDTVTAAQIAQGYTAHDSTGAAITGSIQIRGLNEVTSNFSNGIYSLRLPDGLYGGRMFIPGILVEVPSSGTNSFYIKTPNGTTSPDPNTASDWITITCSVDTSGNSTITNSSITAASGVSF